MKQNLKKYVHDNFSGFIHDGIMGELVVINDIQYSRLTDYASKRFLQGLEYKLETETEKYSIEDVQAIRNYCSGDFRYECFAQESSIRLPSGISYQ